MITKIIPTAPIIENTTLDMMLKGIKDAPATARMVMLMIIAIFIFLFPWSYLFAIRNSLPEIVEKIARIIMREYTADSFGKKN